MSELKTLKDILEKNGIDWEEGDWGEPLVDLREEAIKWIKHYEEQLRDASLCQMTRMEKHGRIAFIQTLFNITEEDLK